MIVFIPGRWGGVVVLGMVALSIVVITVVRKFGSGQVVAIAPEDSELIVLVDGVQEARLAPRTHATVGVPKGNHRVLLNTDRGASEHELEIGDGFVWLLLSSKDQCFDLLDITNFYSSSAEPRKKPEPRLVAHLSGGQKLPLSGNVFFVDKDPPKEKPDGAEIQIVVETECVGR